MSNRHNKPTVGGLAFLLRHKELWPQGFVWDYARCDSCAMGLAYRVWHNHIDTPNAEAMSEALGISTRQADEIFIRAPFGMLSGRPMTPEAVADMLDAIA